MGLLFQLVGRNAEKITMVIANIVPATHNVVMGDRLRITITTSGTILILMEDVGVLRHTPAPVVAVVCMLDLKEALHFFSYCLT